MKDLVKVKKYNLSLAQPLKRAKQQIKIKSP